MQKPLIKPFRLATGLIALAANLLMAHGEVRFLAHGHTDLALDYDDTTSAWNFHVGSDTTGAEYPPDEVILRVKPAALTTIPPDTKFAFLGQANSAIWILPQAQNEDLLYLGYGAEGLPAGVFVGDQVNVALKSVTGPGNFFSYRVDGFGNPQVFFNSTDGISSADTVAVVGGADAHLNWAFSKPGYYTVVLEASGALVAGNKTTSSGPVTFTFSVGAPPKVLTTGHTDLAIDYSPDADAWDVHVGSDSLEESYDADDVILQVKGEAKTKVPTDSKFSFLGAAGSPIWILPQAQDENLLYLGYGGDGIPPGVFVNDQVKVTLTGVSGPGNFFSYRVDGFGNPQVLFNTADGITASDVATVTSGGDAHLNWAFTKAGDYSITVEVSGTLVAGNSAVSSGPVTYSFIVEGVLTDQHTDIQVVYNAAAGTNALSLIARDVTDGNIDYPTNKVLLIVAEAAKLTLPAGTPFGNEGDSLWAIPQSQEAGLLYLGTSAEGISSGIFNGPLTLRLKSVTGPGNFFLWQADQFGGFNIQMNSSDGISDADFHTQLIGSHEHFNWGFTTNGVYFVTLQVSGQRVGETTNTFSAPATFRFDVLPLPANAPAASLEIRNTQLVGATFGFDLLGADNITIEIQGTQDFQDWTPVITMDVVTSPQQITFPLDPAKPYRFFRALQR
jgi:surface-anchored protein